METLWLLLGAVVLGATLLDVFLAALNFDEAGFLSGPLTRGQWRLLRRVTRRLPRRWRPVALRQVTGLQIVVVIAMWLFGIILGFGLIYYGQASPTSFSVSVSGNPTFFDTMYFSAAQLSTVGGSTLTAGTDVLRFLSIAETLSGVILVSLILTFLLGVYSVISDLNSLCRNFFTAERGAGSATASLAPFFRDGEPSGLDGHLDAIADSFSSYVDGLRLHHAAYYFQSGRDQFALPYAVRMLAGTLGALRWGLPTGHPASTEPRLVPLTFQFLEFGEYLERTVPSRALAVPEVVSAEEFARLAGDRSREVQDLWVARFVQLDESMARLAKIEPLADLDDAYRRYCQWLPFAFRAEWATLSVSDDLDYQPVLVSDRPVSLLHPGDAGDGGAEGVGTMGGTVARDLGPPASAPTPAERSPAAWWRMFARRYLAQADPGFARLRLAARAVLAAAAAVATLYPVVDAAGRSALPAAVFGGLVAMISAGVTVDRTQRDARVTNVLILVPIAVVILLGALASDSPRATAVLVVAVATATVWAARFGPRWAALGRSTFMVYYFSLILRLELADVAYYAAAAVVGVAWAFLLIHVILPDRPAAVLRSGFADVYRRLVSSTEALIDAVSWARWDPHVRKRVELEMRELHRHAAFLGGQLTHEEDATGVAAERALALRLRLFDVELATMSVVVAARDVTGTAVPLEVRARLAGRLELLQTHLVQMARLAADAAPAAATEQALAPWSYAEAPAAWPRVARILHQAIDELHRMAGALQPAMVAMHSPPAQEAAGHPNPDAGAQTGPGAPDAGRPTGDGRTGTRALLPPTRRAVQMGVATAASLWVGYAVSWSHQYWATLSAYQVLAETDGETFLKGARRVVGSVAGAIVGFGIAVWQDGDPAVVLPLLALSVFAATYYRPVSPAAQTFWTTTLFALLYESLGKLTTLALEQRVLETFLGAVVALVVAYLVLPTHTRAALSRDITVLVGDVDAIVAASLGQLAGEPTMSPAEVRARLLAADEHVLKVGSTAAPVRRSGGSLGDGGIEDQLTALWSLTHHTRNLVRAAHHAVEVGVGPGAQDWRGLSRATSENAAALTTALAGRLPGAVSPDVGAFESSGTEPTARAVDGVLRELSRVNQTLLSVLDNVSPGAVNESPTEEAST